jgi:hypothetical protein
VFKESSVFNLGNEVPTSLYGIFCALYFGSFPTFWNILHSHRVLQRCYEIFTYIVNFSKFSDAVIFYFKGWRVCDTDIHSVDVNIVRLTGPFNFVI